MIPKDGSQRLSIGVVQTASYWASEQLVGNLSRSPLRIVITVDRLSAWLEARQG